MSSDERKKILQMVEEGKISADEAASLMLAMSGDEDEGESIDAEPEVLESGTGFDYERPEAPAMMLPDQHKPPA